MAELAPLEGQRAASGVRGTDHGLEPPPPAWQLEAQSPVPRTVQGMVTTACRGRIGLAVSPAHLSLVVSPGRLGDGPWGSSHVPCHPPPPPLKSPSLALLLGNACPVTPGGLPPCRVPPPLQGPPAQPLTFLALALSVACPIPAGRGSWCHGGRGHWMQARIKPHSGLTWPQLSPLAPGGRVVGGEGADDLTLLEPAA